eukprot:gnl/Ergobibamus_cyprinoides/444.p1 GENE.gnl/Ergobibamus_cyprinoides/444~~gnl/Ergobibamus_cyprinoides/444.p1  ORF type:complete len:317 (+),score=77.36 gnl/Ergobibamus_cyprinoides/444:127-951(+)
MVVITSAVDSVLDIISGGVLFISSRASVPTRDERYRYPMGKRRVETLGVLVFATIMGTFALLLIYQSVQVLIAGGTQADFSFYPRIILLFTIALKFFLLIICRLVAGQSVSAAAYADDHRNDVLTNCAGFVAAYLASTDESLWYLDPAASILLAGYILVNWTISASEQIRLLIGEAAPEILRDRLTLLAAHCDPRVTAVDFLQAWTVGSRFYVEIHLVLPADMTLRDAHDIGDALERKIERSEDIERAYVHLDADFAHSNILVVDQDVMKSQLH